MASELTLLRYEQARRRAEARAEGDAVCFAETFCKIEDRDAPELMIPFRLWPMQREALRAMETHRLVIALKARQLGLTWLSLSYAAKRLLFEPGCSVIALSRTENEARELVRRMGVLLSNMPELVTPKGRENPLGPARFFEQKALSIKIEGRKGNPFPSVFQAFASAPSAGRSFTASLVLLDEWAFQQYAREIWSAVYPTVNRPGGGQLIGLSTMERGTLFEELYRGEFGFHKLFLPWQADPRRDEDWYGRAKKALGPLVAQEYPATVEEAFSVPGGAFFPELDERLHLTGPADLSAMRRYVSIDYGLDALAALWYAVDSRGNALVYRELYRSGLIVSQAAEAIRQAGEGEPIDAVFAPPDLWNRNRDTGRSTAEIFAEKGVPLVRTGNAREQGWLEVKEWLRPRRIRDEQSGTERLRPRLQIVRDRAPELWRCLRAIQRDKLNGRDAASEPHELTHLPDSLRAFCAGRPMPAGQEESGLDGQIESFLQYGG